jgi:hypothetical protein
LDPSIDAFASFSVVNARHGFIFNFFCAMLRLPFLVGFELFHPAKCWLLDESMRFLDERSAMQRRKGQIQQVQQNGHCSQRPGCFPGTASRPFKQFLGCLES